MAYYAVTFRHTSENTVLIEADSEADAMDRFNTHRCSWTIEDVIDEQPYDQTKALKAERYED